MGVNINDYLNRLLVKVFQALFKVINRFSFTLCYLCYRFQHV